MTDLRVLRPMKREAVLMQPWGCQHCPPGKGQCYAERHRERGKPKTIRIKCLQCSRYYENAYFDPEWLIAQGMPRDVADKILAGWSGFVWIRPVAEQARAFLEEAA